MPQSPEEHTTIATDASTKTLPSVSTSHGGIMEQQIKAPPVINNDPTGHYAAGKSLVLELPLMKLLSMIRIERNNVIIIFHFHPSRC